MKTLLLTAVLIISAFGVAHAEEEKCSDKAPETLIRETR